MTHKQAFYVIFWLTSIGLAVFAPMLLPHASLTNETELGGKFYLAGTNLLISWIVAKIASYKGGF